jgi:hypothetical protein
MKNKVIMALVLTVTLLVGAMIGGCESNIAEAGTQRINFEQIARYGYFYEYRDTETGVHYLTTPDGGTCPRYNADGSLYAN